MAAAFMMLLILCSSLASHARAQECEGAKQRIYQITDFEAQNNPDSLQTVLALTEYVRGCEDDISLELELWLLINEVFSLDGLGQYEEASDLVDRFFTNFFDVASDSYRARFYLWQLHFDALSGNGIGMVVAYNEAKAYAGALSAVREAHLHLDGAYAYREINDFETAVQLVRKARALIRQPATYEDSLALARVISAGAETQLRIGTRLLEVQDNLRAAAKLYSALGDTSEVASTTTLLGETYAALGDTSTALAEMATAVASSQEAGSVRSRIAALYRQGHLLRRWGDPETALKSLSQALDISENVREFRLRTLYELARLYEERRDYDQATSYYQAIIDAPEPSGLIAELEAARKAREGRIRILLLKQDRNRVLLLFALAGVVLLLGLVGAGLYLHLRRQAIYEQIREAVVLPEHLKTGLSLADLEQRFQKIADSKLLGKRLAHIYAVLFDPASVLDYIDDEYLKPQVEAGSLENNTALFECAAAVEEAVDEKRTFRGNAANTIRSYLLTEFRKRDWKWPKSPLAWKRYFLEHHVKRLF